MTLALAVDFGNDTYSISIDARINNWGYIKVKHFLKLRK